MHQAVGIRTGKVYAEESTKALVMQKLNAQHAIFEENKRMSLVDELYTEPMQIIRRGEKKIVGDALADFMKEMDSKHGERWQDLPDNHPDIILMQTIANGGKLPEKRILREVTKEEQEYIRSNHKKKTYKQMAKELGMSNETLKRGMNGMGLLKGRPGRSVIQMNREGQVIGTYSSITQAALHNNITHSMIVNACRKRVSTAGGFIWKYEEEAE